MSCEEPQSTNSNQSYGQVRGSEQIRGEAGHSAVLAVFDHEKRRGCQSGRSKGKGPIRRGEGLLRDPRQHPDQEKRLQQSVADKGVRQDVRCSSGYAEVGDGADGRWGQLDPEHWAHG